MKICLGKITLKKDENKLEKNVGLLYHAKKFLNETSLKTIYISWIHSYLNYNYWITNRKRLVINRNKQLVLYFMKTGFATLSQ